MGSRNHHLILHFSEGLEGSIVEIGAGSFDGSTDFFAGFVHGKPLLDFHTVDFDPESLAHARSLAGMIPNMQAHAMLGEMFLRRVFPALGTRICYAYLDNHDWNWHEGDPDPEYIAVQRGKYESIGLDYSNARSARVHLDQAMLVHGLAAERCVIQFDDTYMNDEGFVGKGQAAVPWLIARGWKLILAGHLNVALSNFDLT